MKFDVFKHPDLRIADNLDKVFDSIHNFIKPQIIPTTNDGDRPRLPKDVDNFSLHELCSLLAELSSFYEYISTIQSAHSVLAHNLEEKRKVAYSAAYLVSKGSVEARKHKATTDPEVVEIQALQLEARTVSEMLLHGSLRPLSKDIFIVSRLITAHNKELDVGLRSINVGDTDD